MQNTERAERQWYLAAKALSDNLTETEAYEWAVFLQDDDFRYNFTKLQKHWESIGQMPYADIDKEADWQKVMSRIKSKQTASTKILPDVLRYAAVFAGLIVIAGIAWMVGFKNTDIPVATTIQAPKGARTHIVLPDSSTVWLNAETKISFDQHFGKDNRNITLEGEAYFDVKKNQVPFNIHTADIDIAVLGTAFNVKAYHDDGTVSTTLIRGSLKVTHLGHQGELESVILQPGEKVSLRKSADVTPSFTLDKNIDAIAESEWKDGWLTVRGESLSDLAKKIERLYNVTIKFEDEQLQHYRYNGRIQQLSLEQVLYALSLTSPVNYTVHEKDVVLELDESKVSKYKLN